MTRTTSARRGEDHNGALTLVECDTPYPNLIPPIPTGQGKASISMCPSNLLSVIPVSFIIFLLSILEYESGHRTAAVMLPGFAIHW